ncbi:MAG: hypothetical protein WC503_03280 [Candidatus Shapirobacteria bacterium]
MKQKNKIKALLKYVILAPSGYNTQPWKFRLGDNSLEIIPDYSRARLNTDPDYREFYMSLGAAAFNLEIAARHFGMGYQRSYLIDDIKQKYSIFFQFNDHKVELDKTPLFKAISTRRTNRFPYKDEKLSKILIRELRNLSTPDSVEFSLITRPGDITAFTKLINYSYLLWSRQQAMIDELETWLRDDLEFSPDGLPTGVINLYKMAINIKYLHHPNDPKSELESIKNQNLAKSAPALAVISTKKDSVHDWFQAGEFFELLALTLATHGITTDFFNYPLALKKTRRSTASLINSSSLPQLLFRLGKPTIITPRTSRYPLSKLLIS